MSDDSISPGSRQDNRPLRWPFLMGCTLVSMAVALAGCAFSAPAAGGAHPTDQPPSEPPLPTGIWRSEGYGYLFVLDASTFKIFDVLEEHCLLTYEGPGSTYAALVGTPVTPATANGTTLTTRRGIGEYRWQRLAQLPPACQESVARDAADAAYNLDVLWQTFAEHYPFFELRGVDWERTGAELRDRARTADPQDLFALLSQMLAPLNDSHVTLSSEEDHFSSGAIRANDPDPDGLVPRGRVLQESLVTYLQSPESRLDQPATALANDRIWYGTISATTGYIAVLQMSEFSDGEDPDLDEDLAALNEALDTILTELSGVKSIIIDLRYNPGGDDALGLALVNRFADRERPAFSKQALERGQPTAAYTVSVQPQGAQRFSGPVAVLTSRFTTSAAEVTALSFRALPHAVLLGAPTRGMLSDALEKSLPNGWSFTLSNEIYRAPDGSAYEGVGVPPHIEGASTPPTTIDERFGTDIRAAARILAEKHR